MKVHEKTTYANRINFKTHTMIHPVGSDDDLDQADADADDDDGKTVKDDPQFTLAVTKGRMSRFFLMKDSVIQNLKPG